MSKELTTPKKTKSTTTHKKVKVIGTQDFIDTRTGEIVPMQLTKYEERDFNFTKIWMRDFITSLEIIGNKKLTVAMWIVEHITTENMFIGTIRSVADELSCSTQTVQLTINALVDSGLLKRVQNGVFMLNPDVVFRGTHQKRMNILHQYSEIGADPKEEITIEQKIANYENLLTTIQAELANLKSKQASITVEVDPQLSFDANGNIYQETKEVKDAKKQ